VARQRKVKKLDLLIAHVSGDPGWVAAKWERSDGSTSDGVAKFRRHPDGHYFIAQFMMLAPVTSERLRDVPIARIEAAANATPEISDWIKRHLPPSRRDEHDEVETAEVERTSVKLKAPAGRFLTDEFLDQVRQAYLDAVADGRRPATALAEDSGAPIGTVNRWIRAARDKQAF
jgi:hypothetical protein